MIIDTKKIEKLIKSEWTGSQISKLIDVKQQMFDRYRKGDNQVENMSLKIAEELMKIIKLEEKTMYKLIVKEEGKLQDIENFGNFAELKQHLIENDYFGWINEEEPERELPDFEEVESVEEVQKIFEEFDYSWWTMEVEQGEIIANHTQEELRNEIKEELNAFDEEIQGNSYDVYRDEDGIRLEPRGMGYNGIRAKYELIGSVDDHEIELI